MSVRVSIILSMMFLALTALAHSTLKSTVPATGSVLPASPAEVVINFNEPARLTSVVVSTAGAGERKLQFKPTGEAASFTVADPQLQSGSNEIKWRALSKDGHPINGTIVIAVKPAA